MSAETPIPGRPDPIESGGIVEELRRPEAYSQPVDVVGFLQTHISLLFFAGERVYKVKKPVDLGFLDFTTLERRRHYCEEELRLNRRLAPRVYLGVVPITRREDGHLQVGGRGEPVEWALEMVRLPERRMLKALLDRGEIDNQQMNSMASLLVEFHAKSATGPGVDEHGSPDAVRAIVEENFEVLSGRLDDGSGGKPRGVISLRQLAFLQHRGRDFLARRRELFERRVREGRIREGHGDLHAGNICLLEDGIVAYDCIEFSPRFRCGDVACDLAFLTMDLDYRGYPAFSQYLSRQYARLAGDDDLPELERFYKAYRAMVRAKVAVLTSDSAEAAERREELRREGMRYVHLAAAYELPAAMILMCGLPGSGKSWLAERVAGSLRAAVLHSDSRRKALSGMEPGTRVEESYESGLYAPRMKQATYRSLLGDAIHRLQGGHSVIVDATFSKRAYRAQFVDAAERLGLPYFVVHVSAPEAVVRERLESRRSETGAISDAGWDVYVRARESFEDPTEVPEGHVLSVVSGLDVPEEQSSAVIDRMIASRGDES